MFAFKLPDIMRCTSDEGLDKIDAEEPKEVDKGGDEGDNGVDFR